MPDDGGRVFGLRRLRREFAEWIDECGGVHAGGEGSPGQLAERIHERRGVAGVRGYSWRYSRSRRVCDRLTGISVPFGSFIFNR